MAEQTSIGIVGTGWVGASVAISGLHNGVAQEVLLHDRTRQLAEGEATCPSARVRAVDIKAMRETRAVVIAAGRGGGAGESRLEPGLDDAEEPAVKRSAGVLREALESATGS